jgi:hypothetical protein
MKRSLVRKLTLISIGAAILGVILLIVTLATGGKTTSQLADGTTMVTVTSVNGALLAVSILFLVGGGIVNFVAWIGALIKTAQIRSWGWFVLVFLLNPLGLLIYSFAGPETPAAIGYAPPPQTGYPPESNVA